RPDGEALALQEGAEPRGREFRGTETGKHDDRLPGALGRIVGERRRRETYACKRAQLAGKRRHRDRRPRLRPHCQLLHTGHRHTHTLRNKPYQHLYATNPTSRRTSAITGSAIACARAAPDFSTRSISAGSDRSRRISSAIGVSFATARSASAF